MSHDAVLKLQQQQLHDRRVALVSATARDPRIPRVYVASNVSVPETCEFYGSADAISRCRVPRSCQDCLQTPGCGITTYGECRNVTIDPYYFAGNYDYREAVFPDDSLVSKTSSFVFLAGTTSYCNATDPICTKCREVFRAIDANMSSVNYVGTQFCKGVDDCVCIGICEVPNQRNDRVADWACGQPRLSTKRLPEISREARGVARGDPRAPVVKVETSSKKEETCAYTKDVDLRGCRKPRTCQDCLLKPGCAISQAMCTDTFYWSQDFRNAKLDSNNMSTNYSGDRWYFPSSNTTYCPASDSACANCRRSYRDRSNDGWYSLVWYSRFCVGQDGCVCIEACEAEDWSIEVFDEECNRSNNGSRPERASPGGSIAIVAFVWIVAVHVYKCVFNKTPANLRRPGPGQPGGPRLLRHMLDEAPSVIRMNLAGWRGDHERLREREERVLRGEDVEAAPLASDTNCGSVDDSTEDESIRNASSTELQADTRGDAMRRRSARNL